MRPYISLSDRLVQNWLVLALSAGSLMVLVVLQMPGVEGVLKPLFYALYGNKDQRGAPDFSRRISASVTQPPQQLLQAPAHSTTYSSERSQLCPVLIRRSDSKAATLENAQQLPQLPCTLMGVTLLYSLQSQDVGAPTSGIDDLGDAFFVGSNDGVRKVLISSSDLSVNWLAFSIYPLSSLFESWMVLSLDSKMCFLQAYSSSLMQFLPKSFMYCSKLQFS